MKQYFDRNGVEIKEGMYIQIEGTQGSALVEQCGLDDLGINATNPDFVANHPETAIKCYPLSNFRRHDICVVQETTEKASDDRYADNFLCERNDEIDNATYEAICTMADSDDEVEWSMELIGEINEFIENLLEEHGIPTCHPYYADDVICYKTADRCKHCSRS